MESALEQIKLMIAAFPPDGVLPNVLDGILLDYMGRVGFTLSELLDEFPNLMGLLPKHPFRTVTRLLLERDLESLGDISLFRQTALSNYAFLISDVDALIATSKAAPSSPQTQQNTPPMNAHFPHGIALVVGIADYQSVNSLPDAVLHDAKDVTALLEKPEYCGYSRSRMACLLNPDATGARIRDAFKWLKTESREEDTVVFFFSGHGALDKDGETYLIPQDFDPAHPKTSGISATEIKNSLSALRAKRIAVILDCCHAGGVKELHQKLSSDFSFGISLKGIQELSRGEGWIVLSSCQQSEVSVILPSARNSAFTQVLLDGLKGAAVADQDSVIRVLDLFKYVAAKVPLLVPNQHPRLSADISDNFPLAMASNHSKGSPADSASVVPQTALDTWLRKLAFLERELAITSDSATKFSLREQIDEAKAEIERLRQ